MIGSQHQNQDNKSYADIAKEYHGHCMHDQKRCGIAVMKRTFPEEQIVGKAHPEMSVLFLLRTAIPPWCMAAATTPSPPLAATKSPVIQPEKQKGLGSSQAPTFSTVDDMRIGANQARKLQTSRQSFSVRGMRRAKHEAFTANDLRKHTALA